jgi:potassium efflux system protein
MSDLTALLDYHLFSIGNQPITPAQLIVLGLALLITALTARAIRRLIEDRLLRQMHDAQRFTLARLSAYLIWVLGVVIGLRLVNIDLTALTIVVGALGLGVGLGLQNVVANFVAGVVLLFEQPIKVHDRVTTEDIEGNIVAINFRATTIVTNDNITMIVPNSEFVNRTVINWSHSDPKTRIHVPVSVAYGSDLARVTSTLLEVARRETEVLKEPGPEVFFREFGDSSLDFELLVWIDKPAQHFRLRSRLNYAIDAAFRENHIQIPFPQRDLYLKKVPDELRLAESVAKG